MPARTVEAATVAALGGVFGGVFGGFLGSLIDLRTELAIAGAVVGAANGAVAGARAIYDWNCSHGPVAFVLDSTWALPVTLAGVTANGFSMLRPDSGYSAELSER